MRWTRFTTIALTVTLAATTVHADPLPPHADPLPPHADPLPPPRAREGWPSDVPQMRWWEYVGGAGLLGGSLALRFAVDVSGEPTWRGGILIDEATYDTFFIDNPGLFKRWRAMGDIGYLSSFAWTLIDPVIAGFAYDGTTGFQMAMMNLEAFSVYSMILSVSQMIVRRERPTTRECADPTKANALGVSCGTSNANVNRSFIGGHTGTVTLAATLTCMHHANLPLWGDAAADALPCVTWTAMAAAVFASRTVTGQHYFSDNLLGVAVGAFSGFVPWLLHYAVPMFDDAEKASSGWLLRPTGAMVAPLENGAQLSVTGTLY